MPGLSIGKAQAQYLQTLHLDEIGEGKGSIEPVKLTDIEEALLSAAAFFKVTAEKNLSSSDSISSNALGESIQWDKVKFFGGEYSVEIKVLDYYKFVNSGVNGLKMDHGSPYSFKNMGVSQKMLASIRKWVIREGLKVRTKAAITHAIGQERKGRRINEIRHNVGGSSTDTAFVIAKGIKKNGIAPTRFWDKSVAATAKEMKQSLGTVLLPVIVNELKRK